MRGGALLIVVVCAGLVSAGAAPRAKPAPPSAVLTELTLATQELARSGKRAARDVVLGELRDLGMDGRRVRSLKRRTERVLREGLHDRGALKVALRELARAARDLAAWMEKLPAALRPGIARLSLRLSGASAQCHRVLGEKQSSWGYPVTLQLFPCSMTTHVRLRLYRGKGRKARPVPAYFLSPDHPGNPDMPLTNAFVLIPKHVLRRNTDYTVTATGVPGGVKSSWTFQTGMR